jgi:hypothetical protein
VDDRVEFEILEETTVANVVVVPKGVCAPASEAPFALTGFTVVARFALPNLMPACFRYELQPDAGTPVECGAAVPLYGLSGGGVPAREV